MRIGRWWIRIGRWVYNDHCPFCGKRGRIHAEFPYPCTRPACQASALWFHGETPL